VPIAPASTDARAAPAARRPRSRRGRGVLGALDARPPLWVVVGLIVLAGASAPVLIHYVLTFPDEIWLVDLEVYREGARSLVEGRQVYAWLTEAPQYLPFTYPPFAALVGIPLLALPFVAVGWLWSVGQILLLWTITGLAFRPFLERFTARRGLVQGVVAGALVQLQPVQDSIRFGQVNAALVALCLVDVARRRVGWWPRGSLVGLAAAVKLTPAVFWVHWAVTRQWRVLGASVVAAATVTVATALYAPSASAAYWTDALFDPARLGPNQDPSNQSLRGMLLRIGPGEGPALTLTWVACASVVAVLGFRLAARLERLGESVAVVAVLGMLAVLLSPVSWLHHLYWGVVAIGALLGDGRSRLRVAAAAGVGFVLAARLPWTGNSWVSRHGWQHSAGYVVQQSYCWLALAVLAALWVLLVRPAGPRPGSHAPLDAGRRTPDRPAEPGRRPEPLDLGPDGVPGR
jgi:alpha-1,2-mannosyltransferase